MVNELPALNVDIDIQKGQQNYSQENKAHEDPHGPLYRCRNNKHGCHSNVPQTFWKDDMSDRLDELHAFSKYRSAFHIIGITIGADLHLFLVYLVHYSCYHSFTVTNSEHVLSEERHHNSVILVTKVKKLCMKVSEIWRVNFS